MRIDAHQHFWRYNPLQYAWIGAEMAVLKANHLPEDLSPLMARSGIGGTVAVQARQTLEETQWLLHLSDRHPFIRGVVGWVDLQASELRVQLERFCTHPKLRGVRHVIQDEIDDRFMLRDDFVRGIALLEDHDLAYDILILPRHLGAAYQLVEQFPNQPFVLDHIAKPFIKDGKTAPWARDIQHLATLPNVYCKVSGMITEADWHHWQPVDFWPYLDTVFEAFGPQRIMFGSDWPVCTVAGTYAQVAGIISDYAAKLSEDEQSAIWGDTARAFYGLA